MSNTMTAGSRKRAIARVHVQPGEGKIVVNKKKLEEYFPLLRHRQTIERALVISEKKGKVDITALLHGGGISGQADALSLAISRNLCKEDETLKGLLKAEKLLTRDSREVERKKPGLKKARKKTQFSKR